MVNSMIMKRIIYTLIFMGSIGLWACEKDNSSVKEQKLDSTYVRLKGGQMIHQRDLQVLDTMVKYCEPFFHKKPTRFDACFQCILKNKKIHSLELTNLSATDFKKFRVQMEQLQGLNTLILKAVKLDDLSGLSKLKKLENLHIYYPKFTDTLKIPEYLNGLKKLSVYYSNIHQVIFPKNCGLGFP